MTPRIETKELVYDRWLRLFRTEMRMPDGSLAERHLEDHGTAVAVLPYDPERRVALLIRQPRASVVNAGECPILEIPAGNDDGEGWEDAARRETFEETGVALRQLEPVVRIWTMPGISTEQMSIFLAAYTLRGRTGTGGGAEGENEAIEVVEVALGELARQVEAGELRDAKTLIAVQALMLRLPALFA